MHSANYKKGMFWAAMASTMWGISGTIMQFVSQNENIPATWFLSVRTFFAGVVLLIVAAIQQKGHIFGVFKSLKQIGWLLAYAIFGLMANLYTFYISVQTGNSSVATILQYLGPFFILLGNLIFKHLKPIRSEMIAFGIALVGVFLTITRGNIHSLVVPPIAIFWGILAGVTAACYVVFPRPLVEEGNSSIVILGWGALISSIFFNMMHPMWVNPPRITPVLVISIGAIILVGTVLAFSLLIYSTTFAPSSAISIMDAFQPVVTFVLSLIFFHMPFNIVEAIGVVIVLIAVYILQKPETTL